MFSAGNCALFTLQIPAIRHDFKVLAFNGTEAISQLYSLRIELVSEHPDFDLESLLSQPAFLQFGLNGEGIHGRIEDVMVAESGKRLTRYELTLISPAVNIDLLPMHPKPTSKSSGFPMRTGKASKSPGIHLPTVGHRPFTTVVPFISTSNATKEGLSKRSDQGVRQRRGPLSGKNEGRYSLLLELEFETFTGKFNAPRKRLRSITSWN